MSFAPVIAPTVDPKPPGPPHNIEAEQALLGCVLFDNGALERLGDWLKPTHFYEPFHSRLFAEIQKRVQKGQLAEPIVLIERFGRDDAFAELGGVQYLADLVDRAPPPAGVRDYARTVRDLATRRELIRIGGDIATVATDPKADASPNEQIEAAETMLYDLAEHGSAGSGFTAFDAVLAKSLESTAAAFSRDGKLAGLSTGLADLDQKLGGLHPSDLLIIAARPSMGKSGLASNIAFHVARNYAFELQPDGSRKTVSGGAVAFFSLEMSDEQLGNRILAEVSGVSSDKMRKGQITAHDYGMIRDAAFEIQSSPLYIDDTGGLSIGQLAARARRMKRTTGLDLIVVDYLQLVTTGHASKSENRVQEVTMITQGLKALAKELGVPVIALSQLSRQVEQREDKRPQLSDLRESGSIEQDADVVMFIYREEYYLSREEPREGSDAHHEWTAKMDEARGKAELIIGKQRHGPIGTVKLHFNEDLTKFGNLAREGHLAGRTPYRRED